MKEKACPQHKRLAMGDTVKGYAKGGSIGVGVSVKGTHKDPMTAARSNNGVKGMKEGGKC